MLHLRNWAFKAHYVNLIRYNFYIHLKDHNKKINVKQKKLGYMKPSAIPQNAPVSPVYESKLKKQNQEVLQRKLFEEYKQKILTGKIDQQQQKQVDALWGQDQKPQHFYQNFSYSRMIAVPHTKRADLGTQVKDLFIQFFTPNSFVQISGQQALKAISETLKVNQLVQIALNLKESKSRNDTDIWFIIEQKIKPKMYLLNTQQLLKIKHCFDSISGAATPEFKKMLIQILEQDISKMSKQQLINFFYTLSWGKHKLRAQCQQKVISRLQEQFYQQMSIEEKVNWFLVYTEFRSPIFARPTQQKFINEERNHAKRLLHNLKLSEIEAKDLTIQLCQKLLYCFCQLGINHTKAILLQLQDFLLKTDLDALSPQNLYMLIYYSLYVEDGQGFLPQDFISQLKARALSQQNWHQFSVVQQLRVLHSLWGRDLWSDQMHDLYRQIQITSDSTVLYYCCQFQRQFSTEREWQILRCIADIQYVPLPYYQAYYRYVKYMSICTDWDLKPIFDKLQNTAPFYDPSRIENLWLRRSKLFRDVGKYIKFGKGAIKPNIKPKFLNKSHFVFPLNLGLPINNSEFVMFVDEQHQISVDFVNNSDCLPGTQKLRPHYRQKIKSLEDLGWKHLVFHENHTKRLNCWQKIAEVIVILKKNRQQQAEVLQRQQWNRAQEIKKMLEENQWTFLYGDEKQDEINNPQGIQEVENIPEKQQQLRKVTWLNR